MMRILAKRIPRELRKNPVRYLVLLLLIVMGMYIVVSIVGASYNIVTGTEKKREQNNMEDGEFTVFCPLTEEQKEYMEKEGVLLEEKFSFDVTLDNGKELRFMKNRCDINRLDLEEGKMPQQDREMVLEKLFAQKNNISVGDELWIQGRKFEVVGVGSVPDYDLPLKNTSDMTQDAEMFGCAFVTSESYDNLLSVEKRSTEDYTYAYQNNGDKNTDEIKEMIKSFAFDDKAVFNKYYQMTENNLKTFLEKADNPRIASGAASDVETKLSMGLVAGVIIMILFTYVISVFVIQQIHKETSVIGALYALGVKNIQLRIHYLTIPAIISLLGGVIGCAIGFSDIGMVYQMKDSYQYYSIPEITPVYPTFLIIYCVLMPPVIAILVNDMVIRKKLSQTPLSLIRNEQGKAHFKGGIIKSKKFLRIFQIRQMLREVRATIAVVLGMAIAMVIFMLGMNCFVLCRHVEQQNIADTKFEYMYLTRYPEKPIPDGGEACYIKNLSKEYLGYCLDVTVIGIDDDNPYYPVKPVKGQNQIIIGSSVAQKYGLKKGDIFILEDRENERIYAFHIADVAEYSVGLSAFMDIDSMRKLFEQGEDYYNVILSQKELNIEAGRIYATKEQIANAAGMFSKQMNSLVMILCGVSVMIFIAVMYLMLNVMVERSSFGISLVKIFGFRMKEIRQLYLQGNFYVISIGAIINIIIAKWFADAIYPVFIANTAMGMDLSFSWQLYLAIYLGMLLIYRVVELLLVKKLKHIMPAEVLKNRE